jgi:hypothetical protein
MSSETLLPPVHESPTEPPVPPPAHPPGGLHPARIIAGGLLVLLGIAWLMDAVGAYSLGWQTLLSAAVFCVGVALLLLGRRGRVDGLIGLGIVLSVALVAVSFIPHVSVGAGVGDRVHRPTSMAELDGRYELGAGNLQLDLRGLELPAGSTEVSVSVGAGEITVWIPANVAVEVEAGTGAGDLDILGRRSNGLGPRLSHSIPGDGGDARLVLDLSAGVGSVEVRR